MKHLVHGSGSIWVKFIFRWLKTRIWSSHTRSSYEFVWKHKWKKKKTTNIINTYANISVYKNNNSSYRGNDSNWTQEEQVMHNSCCSPTNQPTNSQLIPKQQSAPRSPTLPAEHNILWYWISLWPVHVTCTDNGPAHLCVPLLSGGAWQTQKSLI